jgi:hypothetical protein
MGFNEIFLAIKIELACKYCGFFSVNVLVLFSRICCFLSLHFTLNVCREIGSLLSFVNLFGWVVYQCC